jgi:hypothetical protein
MPVPTAVYANTVIQEELAECVNQKRNSRKPNRLQILVVVRQLLKEELSAVAMQIHQAIVGNTIKLFLRCKCI